MTIRQGELIQHKDLGLPLSVGLSLSEFNASDLATAIKEMLKKDRTFSDIKYVKIKQDGAYVSIKISVSVAGTQSTLPLSYEMRLS